jgi:hypothetical protein
VRPVGRFRGVCGEREGRKGGGTAPWAGFLVEVPWDFVRGASVTLGGEEGGEGRTFDNLV